MPRSNGRSQAQIRATVIITREERTQGENIRQRVSNKGKEDWAHQCSNPNWHPIRPTKCSLGTRRRGQKSANRSPKIISNPHQRPPVHVLTHAESTRVLSRLAPSSGGVLRECVSLETTARHRQALEAGSHQLHSNALGQCHSHCI